MQSFMECRVAPFKYKLYLFLFATCMHIFSLSSEVEATRCLFGKLNECFDVLSFVGVPPEVNSFINMSMMSNEEMVAVTCEVDGGKYCRANRHTESLHMQSQVSS